MCQYINTILVTFDDSLPPEVVFLVKCHYKSELLQVITMNALPFPPPVVHVKLRTRIRE